MIVSFLSSSSSSSTIIIRVWLFEICPWKQFVNHCCKSILGSAQILINQTILWKFLFKSPSPTYPIEFKRCERTKVRTIISTDKFDVEPWLTTYQFWKDFSNSFQEFIYCFNDELSVCSTRQIWTNRDKHELEIDLIEIESMSKKEINPGPPSLAKSPTSLWYN